MSEELEEQVHAAKNEVDRVERALRAFDQEVTGWEYDDNASPAANAHCIIQTLVDNASEAKSQADGLKFEISNAIVSLRNASKDINGWDYSDDSPLEDSIDSMQSLLVGAIRERDERIQRLHLKLGQLAEKL